MSDTALNIWAPIMIWFSLNYDMRSDYIHCLIRYKITHPCHSINGAWTKSTIKLGHRGIITPQHLWYKITYPCPDLKAGLVKFLLTKEAPGPWFNIKTSSNQYRKSHCGDKTIWRPSYLHNGITYTGKTALYCDGPLVPNHAAQSSSGRLMKYQW